MSKFTNVSHLADNKKDNKLFLHFTTTPRTEKISKNWPVCIAGLACLVQQINSLYQLDSRDNLDKRKNEGRKMQKCDRKLAAHACFYCHPEAHTN